ncbi:hypothetical protein ACLB2K_046844 [Fragaria x ananassa]
MASSSTSGIHSEGKYDVFINCRGLDTRRTFTCHLHKALVDNNINTYIDSNLDKGGEIAPALLKAIEESKIYVIIFSKRYASSAWCLDELVHIMKCKEGNDAAHGIPIFYDTKPADIRLQKDGYKLEKKIKDKIETERRLSWKDALSKASNLSGFHSTSTTFRDDSDLIEQVVKAISKKLVRCAKPESSIDSMGFSESFINQFAEFLSLLQFRPSDDRVRSAFTDASLHFSSPFDGALLVRTLKLRTFRLIPSFDLISTS